MRAREHPLGSVHHSTVCLGLHSSEPTDDSARGRMAESRPTGSFRSFRAGYSTEAVLKRGICRRDKLSKIGSYNPDVNTSVVFRQADYTDADCLALTLGIFQACLFRLPFGLEGFGSGVNSR